MPLQRHRWHHRPFFFRRVETFERAECGRQVVILVLAARDVNTAAVNAISDRTARGGHALAYRAPGIRCDVVFLDEIEAVAATGNECASDAPAERINFAVDRTDGEVVARRGHHAA